MSWTCPACDRTYPGPGMGVPKNHAPKKKAGCRTCWSSPAGTDRYIRPTETIEVSQNDLYEAYTLADSVVDAIKNDNIGQAGMYAGMLQDHVVELNRGGGE